MTGRSGADRAAVVSAVLLVAAAPPSPLPLLVLAALAPFFAALALLPAGAPGRHLAFRAGTLHGLAAWGLLLLWMPRAALRVGLWMALGWVAVVMTLAFLTGVAAVAVHHLSSRRGVGLPLAAAVGWGGVEWIRTGWLGPLDFPWMGLALPLAGVPELIQGAAWVGEIGVSLGVAALNGVVAGSLPDVRKRWPRLAVAALVVTLVAGAGALRMARTPTRTTLRALLVQPAVPLDVKRGDPERSLAASLDAIDAVLPPPGPPVAPPVGGEVVVLPETAVPALLDGAGADALRQRVAGWATRMSAPILVGAWADGPGRGANAAFLASADPLEDWPARWKRRLVPGVEWVPGGESVARGGEPTVLALPDGTALGVLICIESAGPDPARALVRAGADVLISMTNDAWLGEEPLWTRTAAFHQHPAHLAFRSVELGVGALRVGNNGSTEVVDPFGRRAGVVERWRPGQGSAESGRLLQPPPFVQWGPRAGVMAVVLGLLLAFLPMRPGRTGVDPPHRR